MTTSLALRRMALSGLAALALCLAAAPASAQRDDHRNNGHNNGRDNGRHEPDRRDWNRRDERYRPPPPVYYRERPVYAPPPVYYGAPRGPSLNLFLPFGG
jgi:hypothetical protein